MSGAEESSCIVLNVLQLIPSQNTPMHGLPYICQHIKPVALEAFFCYMQTRSLNKTSCSKATSSDNVALKVNVPWHARMYQRLEMEVCVGQAGTGRTREKDFLFCDFKIILFLYNYQHITWKDKGWQSAYNLDVHHVIYSWLDWTLYKA